MQHEMDWVRRHYGVSVKRGARVFVQCENREGTITGAAHGMLRIRLDGDKISALYHPTWKLIFL